MCNLEVRYKGFVLRRIGHYPEAYWAVMEEGRLVDTKLTRRAAQAVCDRRLAATTRRAYRHPQSTLH